MKENPARLTGNKRKLVWIVCALAVLAVVSALSIWIGTSVAGLRGDSTRNGRDGNEVLSTLREVLTSSFDPRKQRRLLSAEQKLFEGERFANEKNYPEAHKAFAEATEGFTSVFGPRSVMTVTFMMSQGEMECQFDHWQKAEDVFRQCLKSLPSEGSQSLRNSVIEWLVYALESQNKYKESAVFLSESLKTAEGNEQKNPAALRQALRKLADCYSFDHQTQKAEPLYNRLLSLVESRYGSASKESRQARAALLRNQAFALSDDEKYEEEIEKLNQALALSPDDDWAHYERVNAYFYLGQFQNAADASSKKLAVDPKSTWALSYRARAMGQLEKYDKAAADLTEAIRLDPEDATYYRDRGLVFRDWKKPEQAIDDFSRAIKIDPEFTNAYAERARVYTALHKLDKAVDDLNCAIKVSPKTAYVYCDRAHLYASLKQYQKEIDDFSKAIELNPKVCHYYNNRSHAYCLTGQFQKAVEDLSKAIELNSTAGDLYYNRAVAYEKLGKKALAAKDKAQAIKLGYKPSKENKLSDLN